MTAEPTPAAGAAAARGSARPPSVAAAADDWRTPTLPRWTLVPLRLYLGAGFLLATSGRIANWSGWRDEVQGFLHYYLPYSAPWYRPFMEAVPLRHVGLFATLVFFGEAAAGLSLFLGAATRLGAGVGMFLSLNYMLSKGNTPWSVNNDFAFVAGMLVVAFARAGRTAGLDAWLARRWPGSPLW